MEFIIIDDERDGGQLGIVAMMTSHMRHCNDAQSRDHASFQVVRLCVSVWFVTTVHTHTHTHTRKPVPEK